MRRGLGVGLLLLAASGVGCGPSRPTLAGGKPVSFWVESLRSPDAGVRKKAVFKLGNVGPADPAAVPALTGALSDPDAGVRAEAVLALLKCGPAAGEALPALTELERRDPSPRVRQYAARAVARLRGEP